MQTIFDGRVGGIFLCHSKRSEESAFRCRSKQIRLVCCPDRDAVAPSPRARKSRSLVASLLGMTKAVKRPHLFDNFTPAPDSATRRRQCFQQPAAVALRHDARIGDDDDAAV